MWKLGFPLVKEGIDLNYAQIYFLMISDPEYRHALRKKEQMKDIPSFATGMPVDVVVKEFAKWGVDYYKLRRKKPVSKSLSRTTS
ncbi:hypothetical protein DRH29_03025 [candidate division Kazan bacterium]|uniref:Uncharacterized protein n=1 Tax=candidate division Kazan bacterium TaxID=2202143 RepID=A0A420ZCI2_UNCK3|nr:MAG: hypothetical protein DRH29_03025 [candidate division Kazan bacterium]